MDPDASDDPLLDEERIDLDAILDRDQDTELYANDDWLSSVATRIEYDEYVGGRGAFDPESYDDGREWLTDELAALLIRAHEASDLGLLEFSGALKSIDEQLVNVMNIGVENYAKKVGRDDELQRGDLGER